MTQTQKQAYGDAIKENRKNRGYSQKDCARHCGVSIVSFQNWENGICEPKDDKAAKLSELLGIDKEEFE